ncbi:HIT domain-containing protein [Candidatus Pacearchaeota archaeon]|nr:HIT domain-containing protein [Candidatus Pacearchaeota archaeon]
MQKQDCIFCKISRGEISTERIKESNNFFAVYDAHPKTQGHTLIIPKKHFVTLLDLPNKLGEELLQFTKEVSSFLLEKKFGDGFNILMNNLEPAGQVVKHAHLHIVPRKEGDGIKVIE